MKKLTLLLSAILFLFSLQSANAQIWKKIKKKAEQKIEKKAEEKMDDILKEKEKTQKPEDKKEDTSTKEEDNKQSPTTKKDTPETTTKSSTEKKAPEIWRNYKFIPGEKVIFFDDLKYEEVGEFPSRWDLAKGGAEVARFDGEKVIIPTAKYQNKILPLFDIPNYLGDEFTIEYDIYVDGFAKGVVAWANYDLVFNEEGKSTHSEKRISIRMSSGTINGNAGKGKFDIEEVDLGELNQWHHIAMSYYKGKVKLYYDDKRVLNVPNLALVPGYVSIDFSVVGSKSKLPDPKSAIKNIRIAHGGGQMYKRIISEGKYVTNGILFDSGKAVIKQQSAGIINKVVTVMNENPDWKFQIIGHTDSDGSPESNLSLSQQRAEAVKQAIVSQGIKADRLTTLGKGESEPLNTNSSVEDKANNRRVEFIKN